MKVIYKYKLEVTDHQILRLRAQSEILSVQVQNGEIQLWILEDQSMSVFCDRHIAVIGTGNPFNYNLNRFIGTVQMTPFVWHIFEINV